MVEILRYDAYNKKAYALVDYVRDCYGGLPNADMLREQWDKLPVYDPAEHPLASPEDLVPVNVISNREIAEGLIGVATQFLMGNVVERVFMAYVNSAAEMLLTNQSNNETKPGEKS